MKKKLAVLVVFVIVAVAAASPWAAQDKPSSPCRFTVSSGAVTRPTITGPEEVTSRLIVVDQPGSPVEIVAADLTGTDFHLSGGSYSMTEAWQATVRNRSDQPISAIAVGLALSAVRARESSMGVSLQGSGNRMGWKGALMPGGTAVVTLNHGAGSGGARDATDVRLLLSVEQVDFQDCTYRPAKAIAK